MRKRQLAEYLERYTWALQVPPPAGKLETTFGIKGFRCAT